MRARQPLQERGVLARFVSACGRARWHLGLKPMVLRDGLMRDLTNARSKCSVLIKDATHFVLFEKHRSEFSTRFSSPTRNRIGRDRGVVG